MINKTLDTAFHSHRIALILVSFISLMSLTFAYTSEYVFGLLPCVLCIYQRIPYFIVFMIGFFGFVINKARISILALSTCALAFFIDSGIAFFHSGVELKWWKGTEACGGSIDSNASITDLKASILSAPVSKCDEIPWDFLGLSMANYNTIFCFILGVYCLIVIKNGLKQNDL